MDLPSARNVSGILSSPRAETPLSRRRRCVGGSFATQVVFATLLPRVLGVAKGRPRD